MKNSIKCRNTSCRHHTMTDECDTEVSLNFDGKCESYEKGFIYYFRIVWNALSDKNYIDLVEIRLNPDLKIGLYYVMSVYDLGFSEMEWGTCRLVMLKDSENGNALGYEQIIEREQNVEVLQKLLKDFEQGILPHIWKEEEKDVATKEFGWLSPTGDFLESPFGSHEESALKICASRGFMKDYQKWEEETRCNTSCRLCRDFLQEVKGYCLIHNPTGSGGYVVTNRKQLTKKQKRFLYGYFSDLGDRFKAAQFMED